MKKGLVTMIDEKFIIVKTIDNDIERLKFRDNVKIGDNITYKKRDVYKGFHKINYKQIGASVSMFVVLALLAINYIGNLNEDTVYGVVSFDVNPSIIIEVNKDNAVLSLESKGDSTLTIIPSDYKGKNLNEVLSQLIENSIKENLITRNNPVILSYVPIHSKAAKINEDMQKFISAEKDNYQIVLINANENDLELANKDNLTVGRKYLVDTLNLKNVVVEESNEFIKESLEVLSDSFIKNSEGYIQIETETFKKENDNLQNKDDDVNEDINIDEDININIDEDINKDENIEKEEEIEKEEIEIEIEEIEEVEDKLDLDVDDNNINEDINEDVDADKIEKNDDINEDIDETEDTDVDATKDKDIDKNEEDDNLDIDNNLELDKNEKTDFEYVISNEQKEDIKKILEEIKLISPNIENINFIETIEIELEKEEIKFEELLKESMLFLEILKKMEEDLPDIDLPEEDVLDSDLPEEDGSEDDLVD